MDGSSNSGTTSLDRSTFDYFMIEQCLIELRREDIGLATLDRIGYIQWIRNDRKSEA